MRYSCDYIPPNQHQAALVAAAQAGSDEAFTMLFNQHRQKVYSICRRMTKNLTEAEDLTQEVFLRVYCKLGSFRHDSAFSTWLHRVTVNVVLMSFRQRSVASVSLNTMTDPSANPHPREFGRQDLVLEGAVDRIALDRAVKDLPTGYFDVYVLHQVEGYKHPDIARMLNCSVGTSKSQLHKAKASIRKLLGDEKHRLLNHCTTADSSQDG